MSEGLLERTRQLIKSKDICVLATVAGQKPHCSLMAYVASDDCREIYMLTGRNTTKYRNLKENPRVSLLIDTREEHPAGKRQHAKALTLEGASQPIGDGQEKRRITDLFREKHPHLLTIADGPDAEVIRVRIRSLLLLDGVSDARFAEIE